MQSVKDSRVSVTLWAEGRTGFVCSCCGHPDPQIWLTRSSPAEQKQSKRKHSSLHRLNNCPAFIRGTKPLTAKRLHSKALTREQQRYYTISQTFGILLLSEQQSGKSASASNAAATTQPSTSTSNTSRQVRRGPLLLFTQLWKWSELFGPEKLFHSASPIYQQKPRETGLVTSATCRAISNVSPMHYAWTMLEYFFPLQIQVWPMLLVKSASCPVAICIV